MFLSEGPSRGKDARTESRFQPAFQQEPMRHHMHGEPDQGQRHGDYGHEVQPRPVRESRFDRDRDWKRGHEGEFRTKENRDFHERGRTDDRERKDFLSRDREPRDRDQREPRDRDLRDREPRDRDHRDRDVRERDNREQAIRDREQKGRGRDDDRERYKERERPREMNREKEEQKEGEKEAEDSKKGLSLEERNQLGFPDFKKGRISRKFIQII